MLNMKKGLAIVLAAATALTFAPVSTLGLTGVVQANAATTVNATDYKVTSPDAWDNKQDETVPVTLNSADAAKQYAAIQLTGSTNGTKFTITNPDGTHVARFTTAEKNDTATNIGDSFTVANSKTAIVAFQAKANGKTTATIKAETLGADGKVTDTKTLTLNFVVNGPVSSAKFEDSAINVLGATGATQDAEIDFTGALKDDTYYLVSGNTGIFTVKDKTDSTVAGKLDTDAKDTVTLTSVADGDTYLYVYADQTSADADTAREKALAKVPVHVAGYSLTATASGFTTVDKLGTLNITTEGATDKVTLKFLNGTTDVTDKVKLYKDTNGLAEKNPVTAASNKATVYVQAPAAGTYTVEATVTSADGTKTTAKTTFTIGGSGSIKPNSPAAAADSAVFGGVITDLYATDNTSYNLVSSDAEFELNGTRYTANQLKWYLTKAPTKTPENMGLTTGAGSIAASTTGKLNVTVSNAEQFAKDINGNDDPDTNKANNAYIVGVYTSGADNTIVYQHTLTVEHADKGYVTKNYDAGTISTSVDAIAKADPANQISDSFLNGVKFIGVNNKYLKAGDIDELDLTDAIKNGTHFDATLVKGGNGDEVLKGSKLTAHAGEVVRDGVYYETFYVPYTEKGTNGKFVAAITVKVSVSAGPVVEIKEGNFTYSLKETEKNDQALRDQKVIDLDLTTNKTFDIAAHAVSNKDNTSYTYDPDTQNVTVDAKGVVTAAKVGTAVVTVTPTANGVKGASVYVFFRVNKNANDQISVTGKDGDKATVLTTRQYNANTNRLSTEDGLAKAQVGYVQIEVTGDETADVKEDLTVKGNGTLSFSLANDPAHKESVDAKTGQITIPHEYLNEHFKDAKAGIKPFVFPVKVVSTETNSSALTTGYFYVVVDYADASITGLEDSYNVGTSITETGSDSWLNLGTDRVYESNDKTTTYVPVHVSSNAKIATSPITKNDDLDDSKIYDADDSTVFINDYAKDVVRRAIVSGKTEHVLVSADDTEHKVGHTYKVVTINSVAGQNNYVTKIENVETGKTVYQQGAGVNSGASIVINKPTVVKVTVAHAPSATLNANYDPAFTISRGGNEFNYNTDNLFVAATENPNTYEITLIPSAEGTQIVSIYPTEGRLSESDYSLVSTDAFNLAVKYSTADSKTPAQVKGVKLGNKKGAKVVVKFTKDTTDKNIKYYVQKKVGKKTSGKSVGSNRTILSVKKGATVKVRVKAYYYDANGIKHVGKYSKWVTKKTDKK